MEWKINYIKPASLKEIYLLPLILPSIFVTLFTGYIIFVNFKKNPLLIFLSLIILTITLLVELFIFFEHKKKKESLKKFEEFLKNIREIKDEEKDRKLIIKFFLNKPCDKLKIKSGKIFIERYIFSSGKHKQVVTNYKIKENKNYEFHDTPQIEFEIERKKTLGYLEKEHGIIESPGIILEGNFGKKFIILFSDDTLKEKITLRENLLNLDNGIKAYLEVHNITDNIIKMFLSVFKKEKARSFKVEIEWINKINRKNPYIFRETVLKTEETGGHEIIYHFEKDKNKKIYIFPEFYFPEKIRLLKITKGENFEIFLKLSADIPLSPDKSIKTEFKFD